MNVRGLFVCAAALVAFAAPSTAEAEVLGEITRADADSTWTAGSFAGSVQVEAPCAWTPCSWVPLATVQPALPSYECSGTEPSDVDPNTEIVWSGGVQTAPGVAPFEVREPILAGVHGQRLCLFILELGVQPDPVCVASAPSLGIDPATCPAKKRTKGTVLAERLLTETGAATGGTPTPEPTAEPGSQPDVAPVALAPAALSKTVAVAHARRALRRKDGRTWSKRTRGAVRCSRKTDDVLVCIARWRYKKKRQVRRVLVSRGPDGHVTTKIVRSGPAG